MSKYINSGKPVKRDHLSEDAAVANAIKLFEMFDSNGISQTDVTLLRVYNLIEQAERMIRLCRADTKMPYTVRRALFGLADEARSAIIRTWTFKEPGNGRERALAEISFRLGVVRRLLEARGYDVGDTVE